MNNKEKTIYLHIGMPKSGTTSIQSFLYENREKLKESANIFYPLVKSLNQNSTDKKINYRAIMIDALYKRNGNIKSYNKFFENNFLKQIEETNCNKIIFSEEFIFMYCKNTEIIDIFLKHEFKVKVFVYLRKPAEYIASLWQENLKPYMDNFHLSIEDFAENTEINYNLIIEFIKKIGKDNVIIRPFEKSQWKNKSLIDDFLQIIGVENFENANKFPEKNSSFNRNIAEFMLLLNGINISKNDLINLIKEYLREFLPLEKATQISDLNDYELTELIAKNFHDTPKVIDTLPDELIKNQQEKYSVILGQLAQIYEKDSFFINYYPDCYGKERPIYDKSVISYDLLNLLHKAIKLKNNNY